ncbi:hypothetical protein CTA2_6150, partial [Colletotrichum tanaceti]
MLETVVSDPDKHITFRACTASEESTVKTDDFAPVPFTLGAPEKRDDDVNNSVDGSINDTALAIETLQGHSDAADNCGTAIMFAKVRESIAGLYFGSAIDKKSDAPFVEKLAREVKTKEFHEAGRFAAADFHTVRPSVWRVGVVADLQGNMTSDDPSRRPCLTGSNADATQFDKYNSGTKDLCSNYAQAQVMCLLLCGRPSR